MAEIREIWRMKIFLAQQNYHIGNFEYNTNKIIEAIETLERVPSNYLKSLEGTNGLYEARIQLGSNIWRVFCFFDNGKLVILLNGFQKKTQKTPKNEMDKALKLMTKYYSEKKSK